MLLSTVRDIMRKLPEVYRKLNISETDQAGTWINEHKRETAYVVTVGNPHLGTGYDILFDANGEVIKAYHVKWTSTGTVQREEVPFPKE